MAPTVHGRQHPVPLHPNLHPRRHKWTWTVHLASLPLNPTASFPITSIKTVNSYFLPCSIETYPMIFQSIHTNKSTNQNLDYELKWVFFRFSARNGVIVLFIPRQLISVAIGWMKSGQMFPFLDGNGEITNQMVRTKTQKRKRCNRWEHENVGGDFLDTTFFCSWFISVYWSVLTVYEEVNDLDNGIPLFWMVIGVKTWFMIKSRQTFRRDLIFSSTVLFWLFLEIVNTANRAFYDILHCINH